MEEVGTLPHRETVGTVREVYSEDGNAWGYFTHDLARSRVCKWGEDGRAITATTSKSTTATSTARPALAHGRVLVALRW
jgi:hypothetical protein